MSGRNDFPGENEAVKELEQWALAGKANPQVGPRRRASLVHIQGIKSKIGRWEQTTRGATAAPVYGPGAALPQKSDRENAALASRDSPTKQRRTPSPAIRDRIRFFTPEKSATAKNLKMRGSQEQSSSPPAKSCHTSNAAKAHGPSAKPEQSKGSSYQRQQMRSKDKVQLDSPRLQSQAVQTPIRAAMAFPYIQTSATPLAQGLVQESSAVSKLWSILKSGAKRSFASKQTSAVTPEKSSKRRSDDPSKILALDTPDAAKDRRLSTADRMTEDKVEIGRVSTDASPAESLEGQAAHCASLSELGDASNSKSEATCCAPISPGSAIGEGIPDLDDVGRSLVFSPKEAETLWNESAAMEAPTPKRGDQTYEGDTRAEDCRPGPCQAELSGYLASPQLSVPGTPTDYTAFSAVMPSNVLLCNTNSVFSPIMDDFENRDSTGPITSRLSLGGDCGSEDTISLERRFNMLLRKTDGNMGEVAQQLPQVSLPAGQANETSSTPESVFTFPTLNDQQQIPSSREVLSLHSNPAEKNTVESMATGTATSKITSPSVSALGNPTRSSSSSIEPALPSQSASSYSPGNKLCPADAMAQTREEGSGTPNSRVLFEEADAIGPDIHGSSMSSRSGNSTAKLMSGRNGDSGQTLTNPILIQDQQGIKFEQSLSTRLFPEISGHSFNGHVPNEAWGSSDKHSVASQADKAANEQPIGSLPLLSTRPRPREISPLLQPTSQTAASRVGIPRLSSISSQGFQDLRSRNGSPSRASSPSRDPAKAAPRFKSPREPLAEIQSPASSRTATAPQAWSIVKAKEHTEAKSAAVKDFCQEAAPPCTLEHYPHGRLSPSPGQDALLNTAYENEVSPGAGYLSHSDDEEPLGPAENTIQLAWQPSFAEEYKRLLDGAESAAPSPLPTSQPGISPPIPSGTTAMICTAARRLGLNSHQCSELAQVIQPAIDDLQRRADEGTSSSKEVKALLEFYKQALNRERSERSQLQSKHDLDMSTLAADLKKVRKTYAEQQEQFRILHRDKYLPLKETASLLEGQLQQALQECQRKSKEAAQAAQLRCALEEAEVQSKKDMLKMQGLKEEVDRLQHELEVSKTYADAAVDQRRQIQARAEAALANAEQEKKDAWQAIDRINAELDRAREKADRAEHKLSSVKAPSKVTEGTFQALKEREEQVYSLKLKVIDLKAELRECCNSCVEAQSRCVSLEEDNRVKTEERDKVLRICDQLLSEAEAARNKGNVRAGS